MEPVFSPGAFGLIAGLTGINPLDLLAAFNSRDDYKTIKIPKRSGGTRIINEPNDVLKKFQKRLLKWWLYRIYHRNFLDERIYSFLPKHSAIDGVKAHTKINSQYVIHLDLKNAFPSISSQLVGDALTDVVWKEINFIHACQPKIDSFGYRYWKDFYPQDILFPVKKVRWFRKILQNDQNKERIENIISLFISRIVSMTTLNGCLPQGAPTSPFLLDLVISYLGVPNKISKYLNQRGYKNVITIYCDDFVISTIKEPTEEIINGLIKEIEMTGLKVNPEKTNIFKRKQISPAVLGVKIVSHDLKGAEIKPLFDHQPATKGAKKRFEEDGIWKQNTVVLSKNYIRQTRAMMHNIANNPTDEHLGRVVKGRLNYLKQIYGSNLPNQLKKPYEEIKMAGIKLFKKSPFINEHVT